jgi:hypothetical protein
LLGLENVISKDKPKIVTEVHDQSFNKVKGLLSKHGYNKYKIIYKPFYAINESVENANLVFYYG